MAISFIRIDDRIIHGQVVTRWAMELPCDGIIAVNDKAATNEILKSALKSASEKKTLVYTLEQFKQKLPEAIKSNKQYFLITKEPFTLFEILKEEAFTSKDKTINVGPQSARANEEMIHVNKNADISLLEGEIFEGIHNLGYEIVFQLVPDIKKVRWAEVREKFLK